MKKNIKKYYFSESVAIDVGIEEALMLYNIYFWARMNEKNGINYHDGFYWTYNSATEFSVLYPFWTPCQIRRILKNLEEKEYVAVDKFNKMKYDRTKWYRPTSKTYAILADIKKL